MLLSLHRNHDSIVVHLVDHKSPITGLAREIVNYLTNELKVLGRSLAGDHSHRVWIRC